LQPFAIESCDFQQNAEKLTGNTKNGQILNIGIKYSLFGKQTTLKASIPATFSRLSRQKKSCEKLNITKINGKHIHPNNY